MGAGVGVEKSEISGSGSVHDGVFEEGLIPNVRPDIQVVSKLVASVQTFKSLKCQCFIPLLVLCQNRAIQSADRYPRDVVI